MDDTSPEPDAMLTYEQRLIASNRRRTLRITLFSLAGLAVATAIGGAFWIGLIPAIGDFGFQRAPAGEVDGEDTGPPEFDPAPFLTLEDKALISLRDEIARQAALQNASYETDTDKAALTAVEFLTARTIDERLPWVRQPERVAPLMREYYARPDTRTPTFKEIVSKANLTIGGREVITVSYRTTDQKTRAVALLRDAESDRYLVDWEGTVCYSELPADRFFTEKPTSPTTFRLYANIGDYYNFQWSDEEQYQCLTLEDRDKSFLIYGYVPRDSPWLKKVFPSLRRLADPRALTVKISFPENPPADNCVEIDEYVTAWWFAK